MTPVAEMKKEVLKIMSETYEKVTYEKINDESIEEKGFLLEKHAEAIREACKEHSFQVSFRAAGKDTLDRIKVGNPCKGHTILDKSIKKKGEDWTYNGDKVQLEKYKGLVGYPADIKTPPSLDGIWGLIDNEQKKICLKDVEKTDPKFFFTGDYDMHDLVKDSKRILAGSIDEKSAINQLLFKMEGKSFKIQNREAGRLLESQYAWIRHGAQTSFISYLLDGKANSELKAFLDKEINQLPLQGKVTTIDDNIIMFNHKAEACLLDNCNKIYQYYSDNNLLDQIPFYFFFADLINKNKEKEKIEGYAKELYTLLKKSVE